MNPEQKKIIQKFHATKNQALLTQWKLSNRISAATLVSGIEGCGKKYFVHFLTKWLLCENNPAQKNYKQDSGSLFGDTTDNTSSVFPCEKCNSCEQVEKEQSVNFLQISSNVTDAKKKGHIKIDQLRTLKEKQGFTAYDSAYRVILIEDAQQMTPSAANSILKILEEPPLGWIFFLTTTSPSLILPTLVSRCQNLFLQPLSDEALSNLLSLSKVEPSVKSQCIEYAQGSYKKAFMMSDEEFYSGNQKIKDFTIHPSNHLESVLDWATRSHESLNFFLDILELETKKSLLGQKKKSRIDSDYIFQIIEARKFAKLPLNKKLLVQNLLTQWL